MTDPDESSLERATHIIHIAELTAEIEELTAEINRHHRDFKLISLFAEAIEDFLLNHDRLDEIFADNPGILDSARSAVRNLRNTVG